MSATREGRTLSRFESSRVVALLARLALFPRRSHPREELVELLWPEVERDVALVRLRHTLRTLRQPLELGLPAGSVLIADRTSIRINPEAITTDVAQFERALKQKDFQAARTLYTGELLPGLYDDWILEERYRLEALAEQLQATPSASDEGATPRGYPEEGRRGTSRGDGITLPPYLTAFFGRQAEQESIATQLTRSRLVTLTGLGGTGKTRLSVEILRGLANTFTPAAFVALGECLVASQIPGRLRNVLRLPAVSPDPLEQVVWALSDSPALLVLDNFEQLVDSGGAELVEVLLGRLPQLTLLVTSRRALGIPGERLFPLEALSLETSQALFLDRVQATRPGFHLTAGNRDDVLAVCQGLEGIPLALELAAARIRAFSPSEMRSELQSRFAWLARTGLRGDKDDRHRSLSAALDWSWRLLPASQQHFLANLALFRAAFTATEAASVTDQRDSRERLENLVSDSLVQSAADRDSGETRYTMLETVREFAEPRLPDSREARVRFRRYYLDNPTRDENTAMAWQYALEDSDADDAYGFAYRYELDWTGRLGVSRALDFIARTRTLPCADPLKKLHADLLQAECLLRTTDRKGAMALMAEAVAPLEELGGDLLAEGLRLQAQIGLYDAPQEVTFALLERCLAIAVAPYQRAEALRIKGCLLCQTPRYEEAEAVFDEAEALFLPDSLGQRRLLNHRAHLAKRRGQHEESLRLYSVSAEQAQQAADFILARNSQSNVPDALASLKRWEEAITEGLKCLDIEEAHGDRHLILCILWNLSFPFLGVGDYERATRLLGAAAAHWVRHVRPLSDDDLADIASFRSELAEHLDDATFEQLWAEGEALTFKEAVALARTTS